MYVCMYEFLSDYLEWHGESEQGVDDVWVVVEFLVDHEGQDAHLGGPAVVQLDRQLLVQGGLVPARGLSGDKILRFCDACYSIGRSS